MYDNDLGMPRNVLKVHIQHIYRPIGNGSTDPLLAELEGDNIGHAVIKTRGNRQGFRTLVNELISYRLALMVNLPIPDSGIAIIDSDTTSSTDLEEKDLGSCFFSAYIDGANILIPGITSNIKNKDDFEKIILFDHIVYNKDRNRGNLIFDRKNGILYAIDHTHVFKNQTIWDSICFQQGIQANDYLDEDIMNQNEYGSLFENSNITYESLIKAAEIFKTKYTEPLFRKVIDDIPKDWPVPESELKELAKYLKYRTDHLNEICEMITRWTERR